MNPCPAQRYLTGPNKTKYPPLGDRAASTLIYMKPTPLFVCVQMNIPKSGRTNPRETSAGYHTYFSRFFHCDKLQTDFAIRISAENRNERQSVQFSGELYSHEYNLHFKVYNVEVILEKSTGSSGAFRLLINRLSIIHWFQQRYRELQKKLGINIHKRKEQRGIGMKR